MSLDCSTCDGYEFIPDAAGVLVDCPDCRRGVAVIRCPQHGRRLVGGRCPSCSREASIVEALWSQAREAPHANAVSA